MRVGRGYCTVALMFSRSLMRWKRPKELKRNQESPSQLSLIYGRIHFSKCFSSIINYLLGGSTRLVFKRTLNSDWSNVLRNTEDIMLSLNRKSQKHISNLKKDHQYHEYDAYSHCTSIVEHQRLAQRGCQHHHNYPRYQKNYTIQVKLCTTKEYNTIFFS